jgi:hypothetical protein
MIIWFQSIIVLYMTSFCGRQQLGQIFHAARQAIDLVSSLLSPYQP